jgi:hypothetical protein
VVALGGEAMSGEVDQVAPALGALGRMSAIHD